MHHLAASTLRSLAFLSRLPASKRAFTGEHPLGLDAHAFPLAGLAAALPSALLILLGSWLGLSATTVAVIAVTAMVLVTGGLHEDGLGDVADGLGGHKPKAKALAIMKDSRIGAYGALALILSLALRVALLSEVIWANAGLAALAWLAVSAASRGAMAWLWSSLPSADPRGLAAKVGQPSPRTGRMAGLVGGTLLVLAGLFAGPLAAILPLLLGLLILGQFRKFITHRLGGQTGDCLGAAQQLTEIAALLGFAIAVGAG
jgi:adenosylcobinamide-GDP ribazoletransferase